MACLWRVESKGRKSPKGLKSSFRCKWLEILTFLGAFFPSDVLNRTKNFLCEEKRIDRSIDFWTGAIFLFRISSAQGDDVKILDTVVGNSYGFNGRFSGATVSKSFFTLSSVSLQFMQKRYFPSLKKRPMNYWPKVKIIRIWLLIH